MRLGARAGTAAIGRSAHRGVAAVPAVRRPTGAAAIPNDIARRLGIGAVAAAVGFTVAGTGAVAAAVSMPCGGERIEGRLVAVEAGPTLEIATVKGDIRLRLAGLVLPPDPEVATAVLEAFVGEAVVVAVTDGRRDRRGRIAGHVLAGRLLADDDAANQGRAGASPARDTHIAAAAPATDPPVSLDLANLSATTGSPPTGPAAVTRSGADGGAVWLQARLLAAGAALAGTGLGPAACAVALLAAEDAGRGAAAGIWSGETDGGASGTAATDRDAAGLGPLHDAAAADLVDRAPNFAIVRGEVVSVGSAGGRFYLNFGRDWSRDTTVVLDRPAAAAIAMPSPVAADDAGNGAVSGTGGAAGGDIRSALTARLAGRIVEVRGWLERRDGPYMRVTDGDALRLAE